MKVEYATTTVQASVTRERELAEAAYGRLPDVTMFWAMADLSASSNYRIVAGPKAGYVRAETFFTLVRSVVSPCGEIRLLKELGDGVLLCAREIRPLLECALLVDQIAFQINNVAGTDEFPFRIKLGIGFGIGKRLVRDKEDFLGAGIDRLARVMSAKSDNANIFLDDEAYRVGSEILSEYDDLIEVSASKELDAGAAKGMVGGVYYRELEINRHALVACDNRFAPWLA